MSTTRKGDSMADVEKGLFEGLIEALANKHSQLDLNFRQVNLRLPGMQQVGVELNGTISLTVHMRELTDEEKQALSARNGGMISATTK
jgi:hypothetical protein